MKILLLSPYDAPSHRYWREGLVKAFPEHQWTVLTLPPRHFNWRLRGNSLSWAFGSENQLDKPYDLLVTTSMTDLSALRGFKPRLASLPTIVYFHENQFAYPESDRQFPSVEPKILNLYTALAADRLAFNSIYNRHTFLEGVRQLLKKLPDKMPDGIVEKLAEISCILPVPINDKLIKEQSSSNKANPTSQEFTLVWNHRWEYDKGPDRLLGALRILKSSGTKFKIHVVGQQFREVPPAFQEIQSELKDEIGHWGFVEDEKEYRGMLTESDVVLSTALHDFQGLAILEAVASGCIPVVPDRLAYPEYIPKEFRYRSDLENVEREKDSMADAILSLANAHHTSSLPSPPDISDLTWAKCKPRYQELIEETVAGGTLS